VQNSLPLNLPNIIYQPIIIPMSEDWSQKEVALIIEDYFDMFIQERERQKYNKSAHRKQLVQQLDNRSDGSVEFKHQNISAVLADMGLPYIKGYKPRSNYQQILWEQVDRFTQKHWDKLQAYFETFANEAPSESALSLVDFESVLEDGPAASELKESEPTYRTSKPNYLEREQSNRVLGKEGEEFVIRYEKWRLEAAGKKKFIKEIKWISEEDGDGAGYDILSRNIDGSDRFVEVKTTKQPKESPIFISKTEISFAAKNPASFFLYRVFNFDTKPGLFIKQGNYQSFCKLEPESYKGLF